MIRYNPKEWLGLVFHAYSRYVIKKLFPLLVTIAAYTALLTYLIVDYFQFKFDGTTAVHSILGIVLGLFLVFRTNTAYDRWWEGRKQWGALVNNTRNMAFKIHAFLGPDETETRRYFAKMIPNFVYAMKEHLRAGVNYDELEPVDTDFIPTLKRYFHKPNIITTMMYEKINNLYESGRLSGDQFFILDKELKSLSDILGACERIRNTPIPYSYSMFMKKFIFTYIFTLPFAFITSFHYFTIPIVLIIFYILVSIELIAEEIEDPFGKDVNDLPTDDLSLKIKNNVQEVLAGSGLKSNQMRKLSSS